MSKRKNYLTKKIADFNKSKNQHAQAETREDKKRTYFSANINPYTDGFDKPLNVENANLYQTWGIDNQFPKHWIQLLEKNPIIGGLLSKVVDFVTGQQYCLIRQKRENGKIIIDYLNETDNQDIWEWLQRNHWQEFAMKVIIDWAYTGKACVEFIRSKSGNQIAEINHIDTTLHRIGRFTTKPVTHIIGDWQSGFPITHNELPNFNPINPFEFPKSILQINSYKPGHYRYTSPFFIGALKSIELMNKILEFHHAGLSNGYLMRYHIAIPENYFETESDEKEFQENMDMLLSGAKNAGKALYTTFDFDGQSGKPKQSITITPIDSKLFDEAFATIFDQAQITLCSAFGMNPELGGVVMQGSLAGNSGGNGIRNAHNQYVNMTVPTLRDVTLNKIFNIVKQANGWDKSIRLGYIDHQIEKLDDNPTANSTGINLGGNIT